MKHFRSCVFDCSDPEDTEGDIVIRSGKYFELGDYPDKEFSLNESEADAAIAAFPGAPINLEHTPTLFDGKLGMVRRLWRAGKDLFAEYAIPSWLHAITGGEPLRVSSEWDRTTKRPLAAALVLSPRIADAVMMAAFRLQVETAGGASPTITLDMGPPEPGKESRPMSLLARFTAFLRGEGLIDEEGEPKAADLPVTALETGASSSLRFSATPEFRQMAALVKEQAATIASLKAEFAADQERSQFTGFVSELEALVRAGRMTAGECEQWQAVARDHPSAFAAVLATLQARPALPQFASRSTRRIAPTAEDPAARLVSLSRERAKQTGERYDFAFSRVCRDNPELAAAHVASVPAYGGALNE